jgi:hypothetical protein
MQLTWRYALKKNTRCDYEIPGMILLQARLREVLHLSNFALSPMVLPLLEIF